ncbi:nucleosome-remodeling factor subunit NURF301-like isoform X2 [Mya arenaria]|uniref:nucleosome-remodeling factor subunit NURF301-like isoform X2 n=1 Tax=Mya arenaria TaxID=6604 RepID=UPI0022E8F9F9|nr:nucleosome-remodeling factor subunit NURF301-like isoform X2 [Mya arenaria]
MPRGGGRGRGRPPRTQTPRSANFLRKPKAFGGGYVGDNNNSRASTPLSNYSSSSTHVRGKYERGRRDTAHRGRAFVQNLFDDDDEEMSRDSFGNASFDPGSENLDDLSNLDGDSDRSFVDDDSDSDFSVESGSTTSKRKVVFFRRPKSPEIPDDIEVTQLILPSSSNDLLIPTNFIMPCLGIYEILRHFRSIVRLSPFTYEDFCACLLAEEQCNLYTEIHIMLLKAILREEDNNSSTFGPSDVKDSINVSFFFNDSMTWAEVTRIYLESDRNSSGDFSETIAVLEKAEFPFVSVDDKVKVLQTLTDLFLTTNKVREEILMEGNIHYDDHCRACHKLGDLLCCETCSAVYHLACVEPPLEEVPDDDWLCNICRAHQVKGVTDCVSEAEKSGLLCRQDPVGYDRHGRKYWFLERRIIVEGDDRVWYYSTKRQLDELLEVFDKQGFERELAFVISDLRDDINRQMTITEQLTEEKCTNNKKSAIEVENAQLEKIQSDRAKRKAEEEAERKKKEEELRRQREEEEQRRREEIEHRLNNGDEAEVLSSMSMQHVSSDSTNMTTEIISTSDLGVVSAVETVETTTTTTTTTKSTIRITPSPDKEVVKTIEPGLMTSGRKSEERSESVNKGDNSHSTHNGDSSQSSEPKWPVLSKESKVIVVGGDGKQGQGLMNIQSVCPNSKPGTTFVLLNKEGNQMKISLAPKKDETDENKTEEENMQANGGRMMITRSKTGSLTPKLFSDSVMGTTIKTTTSNVKTLSTNNADEVLIINKDGEITRVARSKLATTTSIFTQQTYFKLGMDGGYKQYVNQYSTATLALNKYQHNEERDKRRYLSHKFSLTAASEFKWNGTIHGNKVMTMSTMRLSLAQLENSIPTPFMHPNWPLHRQAWMKALHLCNKPDDFANALAVLESVIKPCLMLPVWHENLGHIKLRKISSADREEMKKKEREQKKLADDELGRPLVWIKYTLGLKHQVWKQRGEEYRVTGGQGWAWVRSSHRTNTTPQDTVGLRAAARKLQARQDRLIGSKEMDEKGVKMEVDENDKKPKVEIDTKQEVTEQSESKDEVIMMDTDVAEEVEVKTEVAEVEVKSEEIKTEEDEKTDTKQDSSGEVKDEKGDGNVDVKEEPMDVDITKEVPKTEKDIENEVKSVQTGNVDVESLSPKKVTKPVRVAQGNFSKANLKTYSLLTKKCDVDLIDVSKAIEEHTYYPKVTKPYAKLDNLLERRLRLEEIEKRQRDSILQQLQWKLKLEAAKQEQKEVCSSPEKNIISLSRPAVVEKKEPTKVKPVKYGCYSPLCQAGDVIGGQCYSVQCRFENDEEDDDEELDVDDAGDVQMEVDEDDEDKTDEGKKEASANKSGTEDEEVDILGDKDEGGSKSAAENLNANNANISGASAAKVIHVPFNKDETAKPASKTGVSVKSAVGSPKGKTMISIPGNLAQLIAQKTGQNLTYSQAQAYIRQALDKMTVDDIKSKIPKVRTTKDKVQLLKLAKAGVKKKAQKKTSLPVVQKFLTPSGFRNLFVLEKWEAKKLSRKAGKIEVHGFKYDCKMNNVDWLYPCPRPLFKTSFKYRLNTIKSLAAAGLHLRVFWASVRWDDMQTKPPAGGTNTSSTETEITTTELLKRRDIAPYGLRSEFQVRKIIVPLGVPEQPKEKYTPIRSGLRERKRAESPKLTEPSVTETWVPEERLELWEIKLFGEKVEKQRAAQQEKLNTQQAAQNATQIKQQLEEQLKQQRAAMQQKRLLEAQTTYTTTATVTGSQAVFKTLTSLTPGSTVLKTAGGMTTILSPGGLVKKIQHVQPKAITTIGGSVVSSGLTGVRPMVKVQIPGSPGTIALRPAGSQTIQLAPKPAQGTVVTMGGGQPLTAIKLNTGGTGLAGQTVVRAATPTTVRTSTPSNVQNVQIIQGPNGQLQVKGLMPGQQVIKLPDGRLQLISTVAQKQLQQQGGMVQLASSQPATPQRAAIQIQASQPTIQPQTVVVNSAGIPVSLGASAGTTPTKIVLGSQGGAQAMLVSTPQSSTVSAGTVSIMTSAGGGIARIISPVKGTAGQVIQKVGTSGGSIMALANTPQGPKIIRHITPQIVVQGQQQQPQSAVSVQLKQQQLQQQQAILAQQQATLQAAAAQQGQTPTQQPQTQQIKLPGGQILQLSGTPGQTITVTPQQLAALQQQQQLKLKQVDTSQPSSTNQPTVTTQTGASFQHQFVKQVGVGAEGKAGVVQTTVKSQTAGSTPTVQGTGPKSPAVAPNPTGQKYAVTPQVVQEVVRQALLQNQTPEIQAKLLAMQKHMVQQKAPDLKSIMPTATAISLPPPSRPEPAPTTVVATSPDMGALAKQKAPLTQEQKEEHARTSVCSQALKSILDKIEREEKREQKLQRKAESAEEKQKRLAATKSQQILYKHKEALKREIQRKRHLNEQNMQNEIQELQKVQGGSRKKAVAVRQPVIPAATIALQKHQQELMKLPPMPPSSAQVAAEAKAKKKKQKVISTGGPGGVTRSLNPRQKLYCVCKQPYDESRFYIGCDLCSNWYHGECVNISETKSKYIDSFICDDCKKQQEVATEELYCLCLTPYDESRFYVGCDRCQDWFHCECVGITQRQADELDSYICPKCLRRDQEDPINQKELTDNDYELLFKLLHSLQVHKMGWPFLEAVDPIEVPDYYEIVKDPMDLSQVEANLDGHQYRRLTDFIKDVTKIFNNCRLYNPPDTPFFQCAEVLETYFVQKLKAMKDKFLHSQE